MGDTQMQVFNHLHVVAGHNQATIAEVFHLAALEST